MTAISLPFLPPLASPDPLELSRAVLRLTGTQLQVEGRSRIPYGMPLIVVSNHRSPLDAPVLMASLERDVAFACHQYMANVPVLQDVIERFGAFPLSTPRRFLRQAHQRLRRSQAVGLFPEGARPMVTMQPPRLMNAFHRGFAYLALRAPVSPLAILPVALVSDDKGMESPIPLKLLSWFDPSEPLFQQAGGHPIVLYRRVEVRIGSPIWITPSDRQRFQESQGNHQVRQLTQQCWTTIYELLQRKESSH